jgi:hypothetical protein
MDSRQQIVYEALRIMYEDLAEAKALNETLMHSSKTYTASEIAKEVGLSSAIELNQILKRKGIQYFVNGTWLPTAMYSRKGYYHIKQTVLDSGRVVYYRRFTQAGRAFVLKELSNDNL